jgi:hypothetical protein
VSLSKYVLSDKSKVTENTSFNKNSIRIYSKGEKQEEKLATRTRKMKKTSSSFPMVTINARNSKFLYID